MSAPTTATVRIGNSELGVYPLGLGTNTFNDPAAPEDYHAVLDGFVERGGTFIDTADMYSYWVPGNSGGESETVIGQWLTSRGSRDDVVVATKVSGKPGMLGLKPETIARGAEESLRRLQTDYIDLYYAHYQDDETPIVESAAAFDQLVKDGKVRAVALSNFSPQAIDEWFRVAEENGFAKPVAFQPRYSLRAGAGRRGEAARNVRLPLPGAGRRVPHRQVPHRVRHRGPCPRWGGQGFLDPGRSGGAGRAGRRRSRARH